MLLDLYRQVQPRPVLPGRSLFLDPFDRSSASLELLAEATLTFNPLGIRQARLAIARPAELAVRAVRARAHVDHAAQARTELVPRRIRAAVSHRTQAQLAIRPTDDPDLWLVLDDPTLDEGW